MSLSVPAALRAIQKQLAAVSDAPAREAEWLVEHVTGLNRQQQRQDAATLSQAQLQALNELTKQRTEGRPLAYLLGEQHFWTLRLKVTPAVLIPRSETELVVERALHHLPKQMAADVLDLGTGSGAIALAVAQERPSTRLLAVDQSSEALCVATGNAQLNKIGNVDFLRSDWFSAIANRRFQLILSNPPYIAENDPHLEPAVLAHEPRQALLSGSDGLDAIRRIVQTAPNFLSPKGWLILEHGWQQASAVRQLLESAGFSSVASHADLAGHERVTEAQAA
ncbi:MAG: peptide chain release factor N(5)-glutamine methyltransferase [Steroidobacteraceae bacterium]